MSSEATSADQGSFSAADDGIHRPASDSFYETETWWFSFFVPERAIGAWLYASVRQNAGVTAGGAWIWDDSGPSPWDAPFFEQFSHLKPPTTRGPALMEFPTGMTVRVREPGMSYNLGYDDRSRLRVELRFDALEPNVPLRHAPRPTRKHRITTRPAGSPDRCCWTVSASISTAARCGTGPGGCGPSAGTAGWATPGRPMPT